MCATDSPAPRTVDKSVSTEQQDRQRDMEKTLYCRLRCARLKVKFLKTRKCFFKAHRLRRGTQRQRNRILLSRIQQAICWLCTVTHSNRKTHSTQGGREWRHASESISGLMWPWPLDPKLTVSCCCLTDHLRQLASKSLQSFSKNCVH